MKLKDIGEFGFIDRIAPLGNIRTKGVVKGIGDDCAVISVDGPNYLLVTTDLLVERVHFLKQWASPEIIGARALTANLSDIAACGGTPLDAFISIAIPDNLEVEWLDGLYRGMAEMARAYDVNLLGGDTTGSKSDLVINIALTGTVAPDQVLFRHTANAGDIIVLTGPAGLSAAGCDVLLHSPDLPGELSRVLTRAHLEPRPHILQGRLLATSGACTAAIDVSDGISSDLGHICRDSGLAAVVYEKRLPISDDLIRAGVSLGKDPLAWVLNGGEDYVLLAAVKPDKLADLQDNFRANALDLFPIGEFVRGDSMSLERSDGRREALTWGGWDHFR
ncbi:MAG: thiamine-phosphate kinase [Desulfomonile tiedjei]|nr:thiamine-phosphate kinase [Desulfomonile tiedjei]